MKITQITLLIIAMLLFGAACYFHGYRKGTENTFDDFKKFEDTRNEELRTGKLKCIRYHE